MRRNITLCSILMAFLLLVAGLSWSQAATQSSQPQFMAGPNAVNVTDHSARIWWATDAQMPSVVKYGTDLNNLTQTAQGAGQGASHYVDLNGLQPGTYYYAQVLDSTGRPLQTTKFQTASTATPQGNELRITNGPVIESVDDHSATIAWSTNVPASTIVKYGTNQQTLETAGQTAQAPWGGTTHRVTLQNLQPNTQYYFVILSTEAQGTGTAANSSYQSFHTLAPGQAAVQQPQPR